jgi:hypothetical protein
MARGFESKDVEFQQAEAERTVRPAAERISERRRGLELSLARLRGELMRATAAAHQRMLQQAIAALEADLHSLQN